MAIEALLEGEAEALTRRAVDLALEGDVTALKLCLDRVAPVPRGRRVHIDLPNVALASIIEARRRVIETTDLGERLEELERRAGADQGRRR